MCVHRKREHMLNCQTMRERHLKKTSAVFSHICVCLLEPLRDRAFSLNLVQNAQAKLQTSSHLGWSGWKVLILFHYIKFYFERREDSWWLRMFRLHSSKHAPKNSKHYIAQNFVNLSKHFSRTRKRTISVIASSIGCTRLAQSELFVGFWS